MEEIKTTARDKEACAMRAKFWAEMSLEEKIERLRRVLQQTAHTADMALIMGGDAMRLSEDHAHCISGRVMKPAKLDYNLAGGQRGRSNHDPLA